MCVCVCVCVCSNVFCVYMYIGKNSFVSILKCIPRGNIYIYIYTGSTQTHKVI